LGVADHGQLGGFNPFVVKQEFLRIGESCPREGQLDFGAPLSTPWRDTTEIGRCRLGG